MAELTARMELGLSDELRDAFSLIKVGRRNSSADEDRLRRIRSLLNQISEITHDLGIQDEEEETEETEKSLSLDRLTNAVGAAVEKQFNRDRYTSVSYENWLHMAALYTDVVILRDGLCHWKAPYTVEQREVVISDRSQWTEVEPTWADKTKPERSESAETLVGPEGKAADIVVEDGELALRSAAVAHDIKSVGTGRLRHYAVLWGDKDKTDLHHEWFTPQTQDLDVIFKAIGKLPLLYHHTLDNAVKSSVVGVVDTMGTDEVGLWVESQLDMANRYASAVQQLADQKKLGTSTGTLPAARRVKASGEIERWATVEVSLTPTPAEPDLVLKYPVEVVKAAYSVLGLDLPDTPLSEDNGAEEARQRAQGLERERLSLLELSFSTGAYES